MTYPANYGTSSALIRTSMRDFGYVDDTHISIGRRYTMEAATNNSSIIQGVEDNELVPLKIYGITIK